MLESELKEKCRVYAMRRGCRLVSVSPKGVTGYPDSDLLIPPGRIIKIEFKRARGVTLRAAQERWAKWLTENEIPYARIHDYESFRALFE